MIQTSILLAYCWQGLSVTGFTWMLPQRPTAGEEAEVAAVAAPWF